MTVVATAGHVDHGKSTLVEALTGTHPDRWFAERERGLTIDLGFASTTLPSGRELSLVDVPGHVRFLRNLLAGLGAVGGCLFVVDAREGWRAQSEEHLRILGLLGVEDGVVAVTKADLVDDARVTAVRDEVAARVEGTFLEGRARCVVDAVSGRGLDALRDELDGLLGRVPTALDEGRPRLWIDRSFTIRGAGVVVTGTLLGGALTVGDELVARTGGRAVPVRIRGLQHHGDAVARVAPGERVAVNLVGLEHRLHHHDLARGDALVHPDQWTAVEAFDAQLTVLAELRHRVSRRGSYLLYLGTVEVAVPVRVLDGPSLAPGATGRVRIHLPRGLPLTAGDRFVLRETGRDETVGGGVVVEVDPALRRRKAVGGADRTPADAAPVPDADVLDHPALRALRAAPFHPPDPTGLGATAAEVNRWAAAGLVARRDGLVFSADAVEGAATVVGALLADHPEGVTLGEVRDALGTARAYAAALLGLLDERGITVRRVVDGRDVRLPGPNAGR